MSAFSQFTWYVLTNALQNVNNTLTAANNTQSAFNANSPSSIYFSSSNVSISHSQQWQIFPVNTSSASAYILRNRQIGPSAYLTTAITTRKCGGGTCATVPVLSPNVDSESLWNFGDWGFSDAIGGATIYNLGNTSSWRLDVMLSGPDSELVNATDTGAGGQHWFFSAHEAFAATDSSSYSAVPTTATALLAQFTNLDSVATPSIQTNTAGLSATATSADGAAATATSDSDSTSSGGLSSGAAAGIGVGVAVAVIAFFVIAFVLFRQRRRRRRKNAADSAPPPLTSEMAHNDTPTLSQTSPASETSTYAATGKGSVLKAEMQSPSEPSRVELHSAQAHEVQRYEMPHPSNSPRVEMEHPSTRHSTVVSSTEGVADSDSKN